MGILSFRILIKDIFNVKNKYLKSLCFETFVSKIVLKRCLKRYSEFCLNQYINHLSQKKILKINDCYDNEIKYNINKSLILFPWVEIYTGTYRRYINLGNVITELGNISENLFL